MDFSILRLFLVFMLVHFSTCDKCKYTTSRKKCGRWWKWSGCKRVNYTAYKCCTGWGGTGCLTPWCHNGYSFSACNILREGYVKYKNNTIVRDSGGTCTKPYHCEHCNEGYYPVLYSDGYCKACDKPDHCNVPVCSNSTDTTCEYCEGEYIRDSAGYNVYTGKPDNIICQEACSWKQGSRCYPGSCQENMVLDTCKCAKGFGGTDCATATHEKMPFIKKLVMTLGGFSKPLLLVDKTLSKTIFWTNDALWTNITLDVSSHYSLESGNITAPNYIVTKDSAIGIEHMEASVMLSRGTDTATWTTDGACSGFKENCNKIVTKPLNNMSPWDKIFEGNFMHSDRIKITISAKNGGKIWYEDRDSWSKPYNKRYYYLRGITTTESLELGFDMYSPMHCFEQINNCVQDALKAQDFVKVPHITVTWSGWTDTDSGIEEYELNVYILAQKTTGSLTNKQMLSSTSIDSSRSSATLNLTETGPYSIELIVHDRAGNHKLARRIILFDSASVVSHDGPEPKLLQANDDGWINKYSKSIEIVWPNRFQNTGHSVGGWLNAVDTSDDIGRDLDDINGRSLRTVEKMDNINGIVRFDIAYRVELDAHFKNYFNFTQIPDKYFHPQKMIYADEELIDGKKITYTIRGVDVVGEYAEDNVTVMIDLSPPIIQHLWLTKGDLVNISVHSVLELKDLTIEWEVYDYHSGIHAVSWKIFDNFTKNIVVHGTSHEPPQGETKSISECKKHYGGYARGSNCYCSPYNGCFHKHYQIKPPITHNGSNGLSFGKKHGVHDYDYFIEVTVINGAGLISVQHKKITIDTSPPHEGTVHDGVPGDPEVDFQQSLQLAAHWDGFFDKESAVWFYAYGFSDHCLNEHELDIHTPTHLSMNWTYDNTAEFRANRSGKYHTTVMAYNHALGHSKPVCSDGVTIDSAPAVVSEVVVNGAVTASGLIKDTSNNKVYILHRNRELEEVTYLSNHCRNKATPITGKLNLFPHKRFSNGTGNRVTLNGDCNFLHGVHEDVIAYITSDSKVDISWNVTYGAGNVHDYEVGIATESSSFPDVMAFMSSHHHQHIRLFQPDLFNGERFSIMIKAITKSDISDIQVVGPFIYDSTKPDFSGKITLSVEHTEDDAFLIARWEENAFTDHGDPNALSYEAALGSTRNGKDIVALRRISVGGSCKLIKPVSCTAFSTQSLPWHLHGEQDYFVTIKVRDTAGQYVTASSAGYRHNIELASQGVVQDIDIDSSEKFVDIDDIDFQTSTSKLSARWSGFEHPHEDIHFIICISNNTGRDVMFCADGDSTNTHTFNKADLIPYQTYYQLVIAETEAGNITAMSDGVTIVDAGADIHGIHVFDGPVCNASSDGDLNLTTSHHDEDKRLICKTDREYQASTNVIQAHWTIPEHKQHYLHDVFWVIEERAPIADVWKMHRDYQHLRTTTFYMEESGLFLSPGRTYRVSLKLCASQYCFKPVHSDGVTVAPNPPTTGQMTVVYTDNTTLIEVSLEPFKDPDIEDFTQSHNVMDHYEWALADDSSLGRLLTKWQRISQTGKTTDKIMNFTIDLQESIAFTKCWIFALRGYTKAGLSSFVASEIRTCTDIQQVRPRVVIDAVGERLSSDDSHIGNTINLDENNIWEEADKDYTPYNNILSAVWPTLRHTHYAWAVLVIKENDPTVLYGRSQKLDLTQPCAHPDAIKCGETEHEFVNVEFSPGILMHGIRYVICIHVNATQLKHEISKQELAAVDECSSGVTIDLTPPLTANVWIGNTKDYLFQTSTSEMIVHWNSFTDVEEEGYAAHTSGVAKYDVALGTTAGGLDIVPFTDVGLTNHKTFHDLKLQSGHRYFATVIAYDFTGQFSSAKSKGIKTDTSPPQITEASITLPSRHISDTEFVEACWTGVFVDVESGISHYSWAVGTHAGYDDVFPYVDTNEECAKTAENKPLILIEGHAYFVTVMAHNRAGLYTATSSWAFVVETSPPVPGKVYDGPPGNDGSCIDLDYIEQSSVFQAHWKGFHDPHSTLVEYFVNVGSCKDCEDVLTRQAVGIRTDIAFTRLQLSEGLHYYVTITACNTAELCSSVTSDGFVVDSTPPVQGIVTDSPLDTDIQYQASNNYLGCEWDSFTDPQSGISNYVWRVGTSKGADNILTATDVHKHEEAFIFDYHSAYGKHLPSGVRIYCTVRAYNKGGRFVESSSNGFIIDNTAPIFKTQLSMSPIGTIRKDTTVLRSVLKVYWEVFDIESFIETQHLSISSHIGGDFNLSSTRVEGIVRDYIFTDLDLHDGSYYSIKLISCNGAKLCTTTILRNILVDSTKPTGGTFAINTDHAAALDRQPEDWMTWTRIFINLAWLGFRDVHSNIDSYTVNIGTQYMGNDLNEKPHIPMIVKHESSATFHEDGMVQTFKFRTQSLNANMIVFISVTASNRVGLSSAVVHSQFNLLFGGIMELKRRCESYSCKGHCVCAPHGQLCHNAGRTCNDVSGIGNNNTIIEVTDYLDLDFPDDYLHPYHSPVNTMLAARWNIKNLQGARPIWYEWSIGESDYDSPLGVFDVTTERVWRDSGLNLDWVYTVDRGRTQLEEHNVYSFFVRVWYDSNTFAIFKSIGLTIFHTPPTSIIIQGKRVNEILRGERKDVDFITRQMEVYADWSGKFVGVSRYHLYISTYPGGHDIHTVSKDIRPPVTSFNITGLHYEENTKYYTVVQAFNLAGLHTTEVSDGFMLDLQPPSPGIAMDGFVLMNNHATNDLNRVQTFWHGFSDTGSGIRTYEYCVSSGLTEGKCDIKPMSPIGIATRVQYYPKSPLHQGELVRGEIRARDVVGHVSQIVSSNGAVIDITPPVRAKSVECGHNILDDSSFENIWNFKENNTVCDNITESKWELSSGTCVSLEQSNMAQHGTTKLHLQGTISQTVTIETNGRYRLTFHTSTIPSNSLHLSANEGYADVHGDRHIFMMYNKPKTNTYTWQKHVLFFYLDTNITVVEFGTVKSQVAYAIDGIHFQLCTVSDNETSEAGGHVHAHTVFVHDWSSIHADWSFVDIETDIIEYLWAIGTVKGGTQLQTFISVGRRTFASNSTLRLEHNTVVFITVFAVNTAALRTVSYSDPIMIDLTLPECKYLYDGPILGQDLDYQRGEILYAHWDISDPESGLKACNWALGTSEGDDSIQDFVEIQANIQNATKVFNNVPEEKIFFTLRCTNGAGLTHTCYSNGVIMLHIPPSVDDVILELLTTSATQYQTRGNYHGNNTEIRFRWTGFRRDEGVQTYLIALDGKQVSMSEIIESSSSGYGYASFTNLNMDDGNYVVSLTGINEVKMYSQKRSADFILLTHRPSLTGKQMKTFWRQDVSRATASWVGVFSPDHPMFYEVTTRLTEGGEGDLVQWQETVDSRIEIILDTTEMPAGGVTVRFSVRAIGYSGLFEIVHGDLFVTP